MISNTKGGVAKLMVTFHPAALLRNPKLEETDVGRRSTIQKRI